MARTKHQLIGKWLTEDGSSVWVYKAGRSFWISHGLDERLCHPSIRTIEDTKKEAFLVFHVKVVSFERIA